MNDAYKRRPINGRACEAAKPTNGRQLMFQDGWLGGCSTVPNSANTRIRDVDHCCSLAVVILPYLQQMVDDMQYGDLDAPSRCSLEIFDEIGKLYDSLLVRKLNPKTRLKIPAWQFMTPESFPSLVMEKRPGFLVIFANYLVHLELLPREWWTVAVARQEVMVLNTI